MPQVALNGRFSGTLQPTGTQIVAFHLYDAMVRAQRNFDLVIFADPEFKGVNRWADAPGVKFEPVPFSRWPRYKAQLWEQTVLPLELKRRRCDLVHHPISSCSRWSMGTKTVVTLHDLNFYHHPNWMDAKFRWWAMNTALPGIQRADHVVAISDYVLEDMRKSLALPRDRTSRIYNGMQKLESVASNSPRTGKSILGVNLWQPHKNLPRLLEALTLVRKEIPDAELLLAGRPQANFQNSPTVANCADQPGVKVLGYLTREELAQAYREAAVFCYPSLFEGFGLPVLEAMAMGTPVVTSSVSALPEVAGGAAFLVDPLSPEDIARGLKESLLESEDKRASRIVAGRAVAARFDWDDAARQYIQLFGELIS